MRACSKLQMVKSVIEQLKELNKEKGGIFESLVYRHFSIRITSLLVHTRITANMVTVVSIILAVIAAFFYFRMDYVSLVIGTILLNFAYTLDCVDGELARYKHLCSPFGGWLDSIGDRITEYATISGLVLGLYFNSPSPFLKNNPVVLILGIFTMTNLVMISSIRSLNRIHFNPKPNHELRLGGTRYLASVDTFTVLLTVTVLLNRVYYLLWIYAALGALVWIRQIYRQILAYYKPGFN